MFIVFVIFVLLRVLSLPIMTRLSGEIRVVSSLLEPLDIDIPV